MANNFDARYIEIAELVNVTNKYYPGIQEFRLSAIVTGKTNEVVHNTSSNIQNTNVAPLGISETNKDTTLMIKLPKEHTINYKDKFIPPGTKFIVSFIGGDTSKPLILGRLDE